MASGKILILEQDAETPGKWESDTFAFEFKSKAAILAGDTLSSSPTPVLASAVVSPAPAGYQAPTMTLLSPTFISGTQILCTVTFPDGAPPSMNEVSCLAYTTGGKKLVVLGTLIGYGGS